MPLIYIRRIGSGNNQDPYRLGIKLPKGAEVQGTERVNGLAFKTVEMSKSEWDNLRKKADIKAMAEAGDIFEEKDKPEEEEEEEEAPEEEEEEEEEEEAGANEEEKKK